MKLAALTLAAATMSTSAFALEFNGAVISADYFIFSGRPAPEGLSYEASIEVGFGQVAVQVDGTIFQIFAPFDAIKSYTVHGVYDVSNTLALGAYFGYENWTGPEGIGYDNYGVEAKYSPANMPLELEAFWFQTIGREAGPFIADVYSIKAAYDLSNTLSIHGAYNYSTDNEGALVDIFVVGGTYNFDSGFALGAEYVWVNDLGTEKAIGLHISKSFGGGVTFGQRDWHNVHSGY